MSRIKHIKWSLDFVHRALRDACNGTTEQVHFVPESGSHSIAWCLWHTTRIEDLIVNLVIKESSTVWNEGWANKTGLPFDGFGLGQSDEDAQKVEISDMKAFRDYQDLVWESTDAFLNDLKDEDLSRQVKTSTGDTESIDESISLHMLGHFNGHRGEMNLLRGMQGMDPLLMQEGTH
ncbi:MAG: hypothetical protein CL723_02615 [Chloroflexi bacterium]|jgi:uncharacterized damage-inducible protein DinB|nr:hypothetical protein [Chloroflexota bacterium]|tara:strand:+ start:8749 stop:9279 length:531 start_codon:yes stop_codon:yes gene_type:complete